MDNTPNNESAASKNNGNSLAKNIAIIFVFISIAEGTVIFYLLGKQENSKPLAESIPATVAPTLSSFSSPTISPTPTPYKIELNRQYSFPLKDSFGESIGNITYRLKGYEVTKEVTVAGRKAIATGERSFLFVRLEIINHFESAVEVNTRNYIRLSVNNQESWFAPEINNDPVEVQSLATKITSVGFPINDSDTNMKLQVGKPDGEKDIIILDEN